MVDHDYKNYPELSNKEIEEFGFESPHVQITEDFVADVVKVHDGDTITLRTDFRDFDFPLRFNSIDAPELNTGSPGEEARDFLKEQIDGAEVEIKINKNNRVDKYGRLLGNVISRGIDMGDAEMRLGYAVPFGKKNEGAIPTDFKVFSTKPWF
jgi:endonuclease YncB( thermonuclease family)